MKVGLDDDIIESMALLDKFFRKLEGSQISFVEWILGFVAVVVIRFFFETFSSPSFIFPAAPDVPTMAHYFLFFLGLFLSLVFVLRIFVPDIKKITNILLLGFPIIWLPPLFDLVVSHGGGYAMAYIFPTRTSLLHAILTFGGSDIFGGLTPGIRTEIICIILGIVFYLFIKTKNILKAFLGGIISYLVILLWLAMPAVLDFITTLFQGSPSGFWGANGLIANLSQSNILNNAIRPVEQISYPYGAGLLFNLGNALFYYILDSILIVGWFFLYTREAFLAVLKNIRPTRVLHYWIMILVGLFISISLNKNGFLGVGDVFLFVCLFLSYLFAWMFSVGMNDIADINIDRVSNSHRPLVTGELSLDSMRDQNIFFLTWSILGAFLCGYWSLFLVVLFLAAYYIYSIEPFRLKRVPMVSTFLIGIASLTAVMSGFYVLDPGKIISDFPQQIALIVVVGIMFGACLKDIKDGRGDAAEGVMTIPSVFGEKLGNAIVAILFGLSLLIIPIVVRSIPIFICSFIIAVAGYWVITKKPYREWLVFALYFIYLGMLGALLLF